MFGLGTRDIFGITNSCNHKECLCYYFACPGVFENGSHRSVPSSLQIAIGTALSVEINRAANIVKWKLGGSQLAEASIPEVMRSKPLFLVCLFYHKNDEL